MSTRQIQIPEAAVFLVAAVIVGLIVRGLSTFVLCAIAGLVAFAFAAWLTARARERG